MSCPVYLLAGETDDITSKEQVFDAEKYLGTAKDKIEKKLVPGGHVGLFMGSRRPHPRGAGKKIPIPPG